jgi:hypothetical protein
MTYLIKASHKHGAEVFIGTVESLREGEFYKVPSSVNTVVDSVPTLFSTFEVAKAFGFPSPDVAIAVLGALPEISNLDYTIVEVKEQ